MESINYKSASFIVTMFIILSTILGAVAAAIALPVLGAVPVLISGLPLALVSYFGLRYLGM